MGNTGTLVTEESEIILELPSEQLHLSSQYERLLLVISRRHSLCLPPEIFLCLLILLHFMTRRITNTILSTN